MARPRRLGTLPEGARESLECRVEITAPAAPSRRTASCNARSVVNRL